MIEILIPCFMQRLQEGLLVVGFGAAFGFYASTGNDWRTLIDFIVTGEILTTIGFIGVLWLLVELPKMITIGFAC